MQTPPRPELTVRAVSSGILLGALLIGCGSDPPTAPTPAVADAPFLHGASNVPSIQPVRNGAITVPDAFNDGDHVIDLSVPDPDYGYGLGIDLRVGERKQLRTQHGGIDRTNATTWTTNDAAVADFPDAKGLIRGVGPGEAFIKAAWGRYFRTMRVVVAEVAANTGNSGFLAEVPDMIPPDGSAIITNRDLGVFDISTGRGAGQVLNLTMDARFAGESGGYSSLYGYIKRSDGWHYLFGGDSVSSGGRSASIQAVVGYHYPVAVWGSNLEVRIRIAGEQSSYRTANISSDYSAGVVNIRP